MGKGKGAKKWDKIKKLLEKSKVDSQWKIALIEALDLFDKTLKRAGYAGKTLNEKLKELTEADISSLDKLKQASQICQDIVQDPDYKISKEKAGEVIEIFRNSLEELELL